MDLYCRNPLTLHAFSLLLIWCTVAFFSEATNNTITQGELVRDGQVILSEGQIFALGFFNPENSTSRYVGIWYYRIPVQTVVWVANRDNPIRGESGVLTIGSGGNLMVLDGTSNSSIVWSTNISSPSTNSTAILTDTGDLVLSRSEDLGDTSRALWQSFNNPTDTYIPNMRAHMNAYTGENRIFSSWASPNDPSHGNYSWGLDPRGSPQIVIWERSNRRWRTGYWNGLVFTGVPSMRALYLYGFSLTTGAGGDMYFTYTMSNSSLFARFQIQWNGFTEQLIWNDALRQWNVTMRHPSNVCDLYNTCGDFGVCTVTSSPICTCVTGFEPRNPSEWGNRIWNDGCVRRRALQCDGNGTGDGFWEVRGVKLPDYADTSLDDNMSMRECREQCLRNCSCRAYAYVTGIQCMIWSSNLVDIEQFEDGGEQLYIRLADSELGGNTRLSNVAIILIAFAGAIFLGGMWVLWRFRAKLKGISNSWRKSKKPLITDVNKSQEISAGFSAQDELDFDGKQDGPHLPLLNFNFVEVATDYFANKNKLGQGGFGPVYKGTLPSGREIAVKRLSKWSGQGQEEFKNEMILIAKLQHRNLVRLLGCCIEGEEKLLIYEYMPNKSLDSFLFDPAMKAQLDWRKRFTIIEGIARGILYLHRDSILRIIHRDLKASNILLDEEMQPKISDFGMARIFGGNQNEANTNRVVGTYGYMSPEYAMEGLFSVKSDVYSFGVLLLEIVSGQRNNSFHSPECSNLIRYAWNLWNDGKAIELIDPTIGDSCSQKEVLQCIHVGMLCVQVSAAQRPTMSSVMLMLESENSSLPMPRQPDPNSMNSMDMESFIHDHDIISSTDVTFTEVGGR